MKKSVVFMIVAIAATASVLAVTFYYSISVYDTLPERLAMHFDFSGQPDRWSSRSMGAWLIIPIAAGAISLLLIGISAALPLFARKPELVNMPSKWKEKFLKLSLEGRKDVLRMSGAVLVWMAFSTSCWFSYLQWKSYQFALGKTTAMSIGWETVMYFVLIIAIIVLLSWAMKKAIDDAAGHSV